MQNMTENKIESKAAGLKTLASDFAKRRGRELRITGLSLVLFAALAAPVAAQNCPSQFASGFVVFVNNVFTVVTVGGAVGAGIAAAGAWGLSQATNDPQKKSGYKEWRNDALKAGLGLAGFGLIWDTATALLPATAQTTNPAACVSAFGAIVPVDQLVVAATLVA